MRMSYKFAALVAFLSMPVTAMAAVVTQQFNSTALAPLYGAQGTEWTTPDGFITVTSTGGDVFIGANRIGVKKSAGENAALYQSLNVGEALKFTFAAPVTGVTFGRAGGTFPVKLTSYDVNGDVAHSASTTFPYSLPLSTLVNGPDNAPILSFFLQGVVGSASGITSITYTTADVPAPVPLPAAGMLLAGGMAAMAGFRRRGSRRV